MDHLKKILIAAIILLALAGSTNAAGTDQQVSFEILTQDQITGPSRAPPITDTVSQGETNHHTYTPVTGQKLEVSLTWNRASSGNDLDLRICPPGTDSIVLQDEIDGRTDGNIFIRTSLTTNTLNKPWGFEVIGARVSGTQSYTLTINSY
ncbi:hypothetical protein O0S10_00425 [Methanocorpusculum sp. MG]|uniref:Peptidase domain-containing protein n=1 Tax=Methanocorpusculum petauri TaxID=3002863 RepID=A0ABT4ID65_9EURY|nr:hypothetical protein [Methanocorpusculum petauri]MCZ0859688.1 hypothetical protein [Methanocorpusculum petauri]MCZ9313512.1 hypothetical protein [Methanocorpusculum sp.]MDE2443870.1 hypothetical protein [Methanocorpusculum sp.]